MAKDQLTCPAQPRLDLAHRHQANASQRHRDAARLSHFHRAKRHRATTCHRIACPLPGQLRAGTSSHHQRIAHRHRPTWRRRSPRQPHIIHRTAHHARDRRPAIHWRVRRRRHHLITEPRQKATAKIATCRHIDAHHMQRARLRLRRPAHLHTRRQCSTALEQVNP